MRNYLITIYLHGGAFGHCRGSFATDWDAIDAMFDAFHDARRITAKRLPV